MDAVESSDFDPAAVAAGLRRDATVIESLLKTLPVENQVDGAVRANLEAAGHTRDHLLFYAFLIEHEDDLDRQADEARAEVARGSLRPAHSLEDVTARFG